MAKTNWQDPKTGEVISPHISGLQEAVGKIEESIGIDTVAETDIPLSEVFISNDDRCRIYQAQEGKRNWLLSPTPSIKKNGAIITNDFEIDYGGGAVIFTTPILETDILTADATYTKKIEGKGLSTNDYTDEEKNQVTKTEDLHDLQLESTGYGVISGLVVSEQTIPNMTVNVASGIVHMSNGVRLAPAGNDSLTIATADATNPRIDIIYVNPDSSIGYLEGIPNVSPIAPTIPEGAFLLAQVNVSPNITAITNSNIVDKRKIKNTTDDLRIDLTSLDQRVKTHGADYIHHAGYGSASGSNAKTITLDPAPTEYKEGMTIAFKNVTQNSGAVTINVNGLGAKSILKSNGIALTSGNLKANSIYTIRYNGLNFILQGEGGEYGTAQANNVLSPYTIGTENGVINGTMPDRGIFNLGLGAVVPAGYYSGGNVPNGKRYLTGTATATRTTPYYGGTGTQQYTLPVIDVSDLDFKPRYILTRHTRGDGSIIVSIYNGDISKAAKISYFVVDNIDTYNMGLLIPTGNTIKNNGFEIPVQTNGVAYTWLAIE